MKAQFPYFGGKSRAVDLVWHAFGAECLNYVEPFFGSGAMLAGYSFAATEFIALARL